MKQVLLSYKDHLGWQQSTVGANLSNYFRSHHGKPHQRANWMAWAKFLDDILKQHGGTLKTQGTQTCAVFESDEQAAQFELTWG